MSSFCSLRVALFAILSNYGLGFFSWLKTSLLTAHRFSSGNSHCPWRSISFELVQILGKTGPDWVRCWHPETMSYGHREWGPIKTWQPLREACAGNDRRALPRRRRQEWVGYAALVMMVGARQPEAPPWTFLNSLLLSARVSPSLSLLSSMLWVWLLLLYAIGAICSCLVSFDVIIQMARAQWEVALTSIW